MWDILRAIEWAAGEEQISGRGISLYGKGEMGILALYAGLFDERVSQVVLNDAPASHWQGPALLNVLRITDIAEVAGAFAPRRLVSLTAFPASFDYTRKVYERRGRPSTRARGKPGRGTGGLEVLAAARPPIARHTRGARRTGTSSPLVLSNPFLTRVPDQGLLDSDAGTGRNHARATRDQDGAYAFVYLRQAEPRSQLTGAAPRA